MVIGITVSTMGNESSQLENGQGGVQQRAGRVIGPAMSPTPSERDLTSDNERIIGPPMSPLVSEPDGGQPNSSSNPSKPIKKKKKRRRKSLDVDTTTQPAAVADQDPVAEPESSRKNKKKLAKNGGEAEENGSVASTQSFTNNDHVDGTPRSKRKSKKRSKMAAISEHDVLNNNNGVYGQDLPHEKASPGGDTLPNGHYHPEPEIQQSPQSTRKTRSTQKRPNGVRSPDADHHLLVSHTVGGSPPSAQQPAMDGMRQSEPVLGFDATEQEVIPASQPVGRSMGAKSPFMHKQEMSIIDDRDSQESHDEQFLPDLEPSQPKAGPPAFGDDSESRSPSVARLGRLERSRSRSISRAPMARSQTAKKNLHAGAKDRLQRLSLTPAPSRSSTGSNESIPARTQEVRSVSPGSARSRSSTSSQRNPRVDGDTMDVDDEDPHVDGDTMDVDDEESGGGNTDPPKKLPQQLRPARKTTSFPQANGIKVETESADDGAGEPTLSARASLHRGRPQQSDDGISNIDLHVMANWLSQPSRRRPHADVVEESDQDGATKSEMLGRTLARDAVREESDREEAAPQEADSEERSQAHDSAPDMTAPVEDEPEVATSQPKKAKKRRKLQSKEPLSLSQLEDDVGEGEGQSRISLSQRPKLKDAMRADSNHAEQSEIGANLAHSEEPALPQPTRSKRKRRCNNPSEDEMEKAVEGPTRPKRSKKAAKSLGVSDDENTEKAKRKQLPPDQMLTGPWTDEELGALGKVVEQFRDCYGMTQYEVNEMIHQRPGKNASKQEDFWDNAAAAVPRRTKKQILERTRRLFNNFVARGRWTEEQKEEVHELFEKHGEKFSLIAQMINRDQKDVRDYWRNQYLVHEHQHKLRWTPDETETLIMVVREALNKIRIDRENNDQFRPRPRARGQDDESLLDWQQISAAMGLTRNRQQCKWKWNDLKDKGVVEDGTVHLPKTPREPRTSNGMSEELANAREDYRGMSVEDQLRLVEAIHDSGVASDAKIRWHTLLDGSYRRKWHRQTLRLVWFRLRQTVPDHHEQDVPSNARYLLNYYNIHQSLPRIDDNQANEQVEEKLMKGTPGVKMWAKPSQEPRALRERQRRSSSASSRVRTRGGRKVSSQILRIEGSDDEHAETTPRGRDMTPRPGSVELGQEDVENAEESQSRQKQPAKEKQNRSRRKKGQDAVPIRIPKHLKGEAAEKALVEAKTKQKASGGGSNEKRKTGGEGTQGAQSTMPGPRSASVAIDSDSE